MSGGEWGEVVYGMGKERWVADPTYELPAQWEFGMQVIENFGGSMYIISQFGGK
jgi:hypothetical protein